MESLAHQPQKRGAAVSVNSEVRESAKRSAAVDPAVRKTVESIIEAVRERGDAAVRRLCA
jgi:histidinol dehydrogenase